MRRRLGFRPRMATVLWGARAGDRIVGSPQDLELARRELAIADLERRLMAAAAKRLANLNAIVKASTPAADALRRLGEDFKRMNRAMPRVADLERERQRRRAAR